MIEIINGKWYNYDRLSKASDRLSRSRFMCI